ncbi:MAG: RluA family pseudouridine synthase [Cellvibrionaceae bacterium]|nr:RluA family pseudouridine synthase [Cellvibrionaceae bacterium]
MRDINLDSFSEPDATDGGAQMILRQQRVPMHKAGARFDAIAAELFPEFSRSRLQTWIRAGELCVDGKNVKANTKLAGGELLVLQTRTQPEGEWLAEAIDFPVVYEDEAVVVVNKPAGLVVHPAAGNLQGTLLNGLLHRYPGLRNLPRAGIVHRLDKDTSGLMVVARTLQAQAALVEQLQARSVTRIYEALVQGVPDSEGHIEGNIGRHPHNRLKMAVISSGKPAVTHYRVLRANAHFAHVRIKLETGRTHQIRVHMAHLGFPLVGDQVYGKALNRSLSRSAAFAAAAAFPRQALHAVGLGFTHPDSAVQRAWRVKPTQDIADLMAGVFQHDC